MSAFLLALPRAPLPVKGSTPPPVTPPAALPGACVPPPFVVGPAPGVYAPVPAAENRARLFTYRGTSQYLPDAAFQL